VPDIGSPPDHARRAFRQYLVETGGLSVQAQADELKRMRFYLETFEDFISKQEFDEIQALESEAEHLSDEGKGEFWSWYYPVHYDEVFRSNLRSSFLISLMSRTEAFLNEVSRDVAIIARTPLKPRQVNGSFLEKEPLFLEKLAGFSQPKADLWVTLRRIYDVRNVFVHSAGFLKDDKRSERIRQFAAKMGGIVESNNFLALTDSFCPFVLNQVEQLTDHISSELNHLCARSVKFDTDNKSS